MSGKQITESFSPTHEEMEHASQMAEIMRAYQEKINILSDKYEKEQKAHLETLSKLKEAELEISSLHKIIQTRDEGVDMFASFLCDIGLHKWTEQHRSEYRDTDPEDWKEPTWIRQCECLRCGKIDRWVEHGITE